MAFAVVSDLLQQMREQRDPTDQIGAVPPEQRHGHRRVRSGNAGCGGPSTHNVPHEVEEYDAGDPAIGHLVTSGAGDLTGYRIVLRLKVRSRYSRFGDFRVSEKEMEIMDFRER